MSGSRSLAMAACSTRFWLTFGAFYNCTDLDLMERVLLDSLIAAIVGYLFGAVPTGAVVARLWGGVDLTKVGSGKTGATNVLRTLGPVPAAIVFIGDFLKGALPVFLAGALFGRDSWAIAVAGIAAVVGHVYSPFLGFKGGRGVVTGLSALVALSPLAAGAGLLVGAAVIATTRYVSLGSVTGTIVGGLSLLAQVLIGGQPLPHAAFALIVGTFIVVAHHDNIGRLLQGTERRIGGPAEPA